MSLETISLEAWFRIIFVVLAFVLYMDRRALCRPTELRRRSKKVTGNHGILEWCVVPVMLLGTASLLTYLAGVGEASLSLPLPRWLRFIGVAGMIACIPLSHWTHVTLGGYFSKKLELQTDHQLVCTGPYRYVRHPIYAVLFLGALSGSLMSAYGPMAVMACAVVLLFMRRIKKEEDMLVNRFGEAYLRYRESTPAFIPIPKVL